MSISRLLVVGWDGAEPSLVEPLIESGRLPNLAGLIAGGTFGRVNSTFPASSLPAWTAAFSGLGPSKHGLVDFVRKQPGQYRLRLVSAAERSGTSLARIAMASGLKVASLGIPGTFPPDPAGGICIAGFDSPTATRASTRAHNPAGLFKRLKAAGLYWPYGAADELAVGAGWHANTRRILFETIEQKTKVAEALLDGSRFDLFSIIFSESDTAGHHFWAFHDQNSPRQRVKNPVLATTIEDVYIALDRALGRLLARTSKSTSVIVLSDHGFGGSSDHTFCLNRWLAAQGRLRFSAFLGKLAQLSGFIQDQAGRFLPATVKQALLRGPFSRLVMAADGLGRFGGIDFSATEAFCDELPQNPGIWINLAGRESQGTVPAERYQSLRKEIADSLIDWRDPLSGRAIVANVFFREDVMAGPFTGRAPDLMLELADWDGYRLLASPSAGRMGPIVERLAEDKLIGSKGTGTSGVHKPEGILAACGPSVKTGTKIENARLVDVCPTALALLGLRSPPDLDGHSLTQIASECAAEGQSPACSAQAGQAVYSPEEEKLVLKRLKGLGYL
ncbi:MAG: alkaline phosphatase family protein [Deltaproteobacteria bacterium]|nr:alkaline phosphatase family protein [Deltaproteobacteria bacterium]